MNDWIDVNHSLPDEGVPVMVALRSPWFGPRELTLVDVMNCGEFGLGRDVEAWRPLEPGELQAIAGDVVV